MDFAIIKGFFTFFMDEKKKSNLFSPISVLVLSIIRPTTVFSGIYFIFVRKGAIALILALNFKKLTRRIESFNDIIRHTCQIHSFVFFFLNILQSTIKKIPLSLFQNSRYFFFHNFFMKSESTTTSISVLINIFRKRIKGPSQVHTKCRLTFQTSAGSARGSLCSQPKPFYINFLKYVLLRLSL